MKKLASMLGLAAVLFVTMSVVASAKDGKTMTWTGWVSDSACGTKGTNADHAACAAKCVKEKGASWVFVNGKDKKVLTIHNQDVVSADNDLGHEVKVTGHLMDDGKLHVDKIESAKMM
jgi:hypothetical protein